MRPVHPHTNMDKTSLFVAAGWLTEIRLHRRLACIARYPPQGLYDVAQLHRGALPQALPDSQELWRQRVPSLTTCERRRTLVGLALSVD